MQFLPSGGKSRLHRHPTAHAIEFQQSGLFARSEMMPTVSTIVTPEAAPGLCSTEGETMQNVVNRRWLLARYPEGMPAPDNWVMDTQPAPDPGPSQILVKAKWLSVDPYMRGRMSPTSNYTKGVGLGEVMHGGGEPDIGERFMGHLIVSRA